MIDSRRELLLAKEITIETDRWYRSDFVCMLFGYSDGSQTFRQAWLGSEPRIRHTPVCKGVSLIHGADIEEALKQRSIAPKRAAKNVARKASKKTKPSEPLQEYLEPRRPKRRAKRKPLQETIEPKRKKSA